MENKNLLVVQSGGPTSAINASLAGVIKESYANKKINKVYGSVNGITGIIEDNIIELDFSEEELETLRKTPAAYLGSSRYILGSTYLDAKYNLTGEYSNIIRTIKLHNIGYICFIGGNDSMDTVNKLSTFLHEIKYPCNVIGIPKTIDNDLVEIDHTPGYGSACKYIANTISELKLDTSVYSRGRVTIVEIMGRDAGWLTASSKLASINGYGPDLIYLPEVAFDVSLFLKDVSSIYSKNKNVLVAVSEGLKDKKGNYILNSYKYNELNDVFGHQQLGGLSTVLAQIVFTKLKLPVRSIELNLMQRCASHISSACDLDEAMKCGEFGVKSALNESGKFVSMERVSNEPYQIKFTLKNVNDVANQVKNVPLEWIVNGNDISDEYIRYALPLIQGEVKQTMENGLPKYLKR